MSEFNARDYDGVTFESEHAENERAALLAAEADENAARETEPGWLISRLIEDDRDGWVSGQRAVRNAIRNEEADRMPVTTDAISITSNRRAA